MLFSGENVKNRQLTLTVFIVFAFDYSIISALN